MLVDCSSRLYFNNCFVICHFCVKPLDIIQGTLGRFPDVFLVTKKQTFLAGSQDIPSCVSGDKNRYLKS